jgi:nucleoside-diphosphate-sugar epimerase
VLPSASTDLAVDPSEPFTKSSVVVTGGAGFIGHHLVRELVRRGHDVRVVDNLLTGFAERLADIPAATLVQTDIRELETLRAALEGTDTVFHLAALPSVQRSLKNPIETHEINVTGTINVMLAAASAGVRRVVLAGSSSVYGQAPGLPRREGQQPDPQSPYAVSKLAAEGYMRTLGQAHGIETVVLRYFNVFGPGQDPSSQYAAVVPRFITAALEGRRPTVFGDGLQTRDFTYVENVVSANLLAATVPDAPGGVFNIGCGERHTVLDLLGAIGRALDRDLQPDYAPPLHGDVRDSEADITRAVEQLGYRPEVDMETGIRRTVMSYERAAP